MFSSLVVCLGLLGPAHADSPKVVTLNLHDQLMEGYDAAFHPELVDPDRLSRHPLSADRGPQCLTPLVGLIKENWELFTPAEKAEITSRLAPWKKDLVAPMRDPADPPPPPGDTCFSAGTGNVLEGEHFNVEWDSAVSESTAQNFLDALEYAWGVEFDELGWEAPDGTYQYPMLAYITTSYRDGAYTTVERCGSYYMPYIVAGSNSFDWGTWYQDMAGHELNHASQFAYGYSHEFWWWEATATWVEEYIYPAHNSWSSYTWGYSANPHLAMNASSQSSQDVFMHMYGMAVLGFYLDEHVGGHDFVKGTWDEIRGGGSCGYYCAFIGDVVEDQGEDWTSVYMGFMATNAAMDYSESRAFYEVDLVDTVSSLPADGASSSRTEPEGHGQNYIKFKDDVAEVGKLLHVDFVGEDSIDWYALLVEVDGSSVVQVVNLLEGEGTTASGEIELTGNDVYLVVSPDSQHDNSYTYSWTAEEIDPDVVAEGGDDTASEIDDTPAPKKPEGCGCATAAGTGSALLWGVLGLVALRRRED